MIFCFSETLQGYCTCGFFLLLFSFCFVFLLAFPGRTPCKILVLVAFCGFEQFPHFCNLFFSPDVRRGMLPHTLSWIVSPFCPLVLESRGYCIGITKLDSRHAEKQKALLMLPRKRMSLRTWWMQLEAKGNRRK